MAPFLFMVQSVLVLCDIKLLVKGASININLCKEENQWCLINTLSSVNLCLNVLKCGFYGIQNSPNQKLWLEFGILCLNKEIWGLVNQACLPLLSLRSDKNDRPVCHMANIVFIRYWIFPDGSMLKKNAVLSWKVLFQQWFFFKLIDCLKEIITSLST